MSCKYKMNLRIFSMNNNSPMWKALYIKYSKILKKKVIREAKKQHYSRLPAKSDTKMRTAWILWRKRQKKVHSVEQMPSLLINNEEFKNAKYVASALKKLFLTVPQKQYISGIEGVRYPIFKRSISWKLSLTQK